MVDLLSIFNLVAPFFGLILLGFVIGRWKQLPEEGLAWLQFFLIYVALPPLFYRLIADKPLSELANWKFILCTTTATFCAFCLSFALGLKHTHGNMPQAVMQGVAGAYSNIGYMGPPLILAALGPDASAPVVLIFVFAFGVDPTWSWLLFPVALLFLFVLTGAVSTALSVLYVRFRDVAIIWVVVAQVLLYGTPILYPITALKDATLEHILMVNPLAVIFEQVRVWILAEPQAPTAAEAAGGVAGLIPAALIFAGVCAFAVWFFNREAPRIAEDL